MRTSELVVVLLLAFPVTIGASDPQGQLSQETVPELAGAEPVTGPVLVDGELPSPYVDYIVQIGPDRTQKLSIYQNGLVTMTTRIGKRTSLKRVLFPPSAIDTYREYLNPGTLQKIDLQPKIATPTHMRETIRIYDGEGVATERQYDPSLYLPAELERARLLLEDLSRIIVEDNEITSPFIDYDPHPGDILLDTQMLEWQILRIVDENIEVKEEDGPLRAWIKKNQLDEQFVSWSRPTPPTE